MFATALLFFFHFGFYGLDQPVRNIAGRKFAHHRKSLKTSNLQYKKTFFDINGTYINEIGIDIIFKRTVAYFW